MPSTSRRFKFVLWVAEAARPGTDPNNEYNGALEELKQFFKKYVIPYWHGGCEVCPTTGKRHVDGYYECENPRKMSTELKKFNNTFGKGWGDLQIAKGNAGENQDYSSKEQGLFIKFGTPSAGQGARTDLKAAVEAVNNGKDPEDFILENPEFYHQYARTLNKAEDVALRRKGRTEMTEGLWLHGPTGVGKSHRAFEGWNPDTHYLWKDDNGWQDGYKGQEIVIINDFRGDTIKYNELLQLVDKWPHTVRRRCKEPAPFLAKKVIITSALPPEEVFKMRNEFDSIAQLLRRFKVEEMK